MNRQHTESAAAIIARLSERLGQLEKRSTVQAHASEERRRDGQTLVLLKLMRRDLDDLQQHAEQTSRDAARGQQLTHIMKLLTSTLDLEQVLTEIIDSVISFLGAQRAFLLLTDGTQSDSEISVARNWTQETLPKDEVSFSRTIVQHVCQTHSLVITHSLQAESWLRKIESTALLDVRLVACLPLLIQGHLIGVIYADSKDSQQLIGSEAAETESILAIFADQAAIAIKNARAFQQVQTDLHDAQRQIQHQLLKEIRLFQKPSEMFHMLVYAVGQLLGASYAAIEVAQGNEYRIVAAYGEPTDSIQSISLTFHQDVVGRLLLASIGDRGWMLDDVRQQIGVMVYTIRLNAELQQVRENMVIAHEEERRRVCDELHDVIGSRLAVMPILLDLVATAKPEEAQRLLSTLKEQVQNVIQEIQRFVRQLRPTSLDQVGLLGALNQVIHELTMVGKVKVAFSAPSQLPKLLDAVEIAAYRIVNEALTNIVRHAQASNCCITLDIQADELWIDVSDNGHGMPQEILPGVGLNSMRERAAELGGSFVLRSTVGEGTRVTARLPLYMPGVRQ